MRTQSVGDLSPLWNVSKLEIVDTCKPSRHDVNFIRTKVVVRVMSLGAAPSASTNQNGGASQADPVQEYIHTRCISTVVKRGKAPNLRGEDEALEVNGRDANV